MHYRDALFYQRGLTRREEKIRTRGEKETRGRERVSQPNESHEECWSVYIFCLGYHRFRFGVRVPVPVISLGRYISIDEIAQVHGNSTFAERELCTLMGIFLPTFESLGYQLSYSLFFPRNYTGTATFYRYFYGNLF